MNRKSLIRGFIVVYLLLYATLYICALTFLPIPPDNIRFADTTLGFILGTVISTILNYYIGDKVKDHYEETKDTSN